MNKEVVSNKQAISIMVILLSGTSSALLFGKSAGKDVWLAIIIAVSAALITGLMFARIHYIFPDKSLFDVLEICFGRIAGKLLSIAFVWYALHTATDVLTNMTFFIQTVTFPETPRIATVLLIMVLCAWASKEGIEVMGRWSAFFIPFYIGAIMIAVLLLIPRMDLNNIRPVLYKGITPVLRGAFYTFSFPFGEIVVFSMIFSGFETRKSPFKIYITSLLIAGAVVLLISLTDILVLGVDLASELYYPSYSAVTKISIGEFLQRLEIIAALVMMLGGFIKVSTYLMASCRGIEKIFGYRDYRFITVPVALLIVNMSDFMYKSVFDFNEWNEKGWPYFALLFQVILPGIILIAGEIKKNAEGYKNSE